MGITLQIIIILGVLIFAILRKVLHSDLNKEETMQERTPDYPVYPPPPPSCSTPGKTVSKKRHEFATPFIPDEAINKPMEDEKTKPEFNIHSIEEIRRAVIWSEILNRKY